MEVLSSRLLLHPADFGRTVAFYRDTLGLHVSREYGADGCVVGVVFHLGGGFLEVADTPPGEGGTGRPVDLWLQVRDIEAEGDRLRAAGLDVGRPARMPWGLIELWLSDPDGNRIVLVEIPDDHPLRTRMSVGS